MKVDWKIFLAGGITIVLIIFGVWMFVLRFSSNKPSNTLETNQFGTSSNVPADTSGNASDNTSTSIPTTQNIQQKIFKISDGPVAGATFVQTLHPTTTLARYVMADNGHVLELAVDSPGAVARAVSNTTIPGAVRALWREDGGSSVLQYMDSGTIKTVILTMPAQSASSTLGKSVKLQFLPDDIADLAVSPDGNQIAYLLTTASGSDGYTVKNDGTGSKKLFSLPLSEIVISWPSSNTILAQTKSAAGVLGAIFSVNTSSGNVTPLLYAEGLTATADTSFARVVYQTVSDSTRNSYVHDTKKGGDTALSYDPMPEKCAWGADTALFCALPISYVPFDYLDSWHKGVASASDAVVLFDLSTGRNTILAVPGGGDGGVNSDIAEMTVSPDQHYLLFIKRGDRSLWGVRLQ